MKIRTTKRIKEKNQRILQNQSSDFNNILDNILKTYSNKPLDNEKQQGLESNFLKIQKLLNEDSEKHLKNCNIADYLKLASHKQNYPLLELLLTKIPSDKITQKILDDSLHSFFNSIYWRNGDRVPIVKNLEKTSNDPDIVVKFNIVKILISRGAQCDKDDFDTLVYYDQIDLIEVILINTKNGLNQKTLNSGVDNALGNMSSLSVYYSTDPQYSPYESVKIKTKFKIVTMLFDFGAHHRVETFTWIVKDWITKNDKIQFLDMLLNHPNNIISKKLLSDALHGLWGYGSQMGFSGTIYSPDSEDESVRLKFQLVKMLTDRGALCGLDDFERLVVYKQNNLITLVNLEATPEMINNFLVEYFRSYGMNKLPLVKALIKNKNPEIANGTINAVLKSGKFKLLTSALEDVNDNQ